MYKPNCYDNVELLEKNVKNLLIKKWQTILWSWTPSTALSQNWPWRLFCDKDDIFPKSNIVERSMWAEMSSYLNQNRWRGFLSVINNNFLQKVFFAIPPLSLLCCYSELQTWICFKERLLDVKSNLILKFRLTSRAREKLTPYPHNIKTFSCRIATDPCIVYSEH